MQSQFRSILNSLSFLQEREWLVLICLAIFTESLGLGLTTPVVALYAQSFGVNNTLVGLLFTTFAIGRVLVTIPAGRAADRWGRQIVMLLGLLAQFISALAQSLATDYWQLAVFRPLQGVGSAMMMSSAFLIIADKSTSEERGRVTSIFQSSVIIGLTIGPWLGGLLATHFSMRTPFLFYAIISFGVGILLWHYSSWALEKKEYTSEANKKRRKHSSPITDMYELLKNRNFLLISLAAFFIFFGRAGARDTILPLLGADMLSLTPASLGLIFSLIQLTNLITVPISGLISDHVGRKCALFFGLSFQGLGMTLAGLASNYPYFLSGSLLMGAGKGLGETSSVVYIADNSSPGKYGTTYGLFLTLRDLGLLIGPLMLGWMADIAGLRFPLLFNGIALVISAVLFAFMAQETLKKK